jgi:hypothetical protein
VQPGDVPSRIEALMDERSKLENELTEARKKLALGGGGAAGGDESRDIGGVKYLGKVVTGVAPKELKGLVDAAKASLGSGVVLLIAERGRQGGVVVGVTEDLTAAIGCRPGARRGLRSARRQGRRRPARHGPGRRPGRCQRQCSDRCGGGSAELTPARLALDQMIRSNARDQPGRFAFAVTIGRHRHPQLSKICAVGMCC